MTYQEFLLTISAGDGVKIKTFSGVQSVYVGGKSFIVTNDLQELGTRCTAKQALESTQLRYLILNDFIICEAGVERFIKEV